MTEPTHAVIDGSGLYELMSEAEAVTMSTPCGQHSSGLSVGSLGDSRIAFVPRHGAQHELPPHLINYRANV
jgi:5'-methylthioadenosine phosphorylase